MFPDSQSHLGHAGYFPTAVIDLACLGGDPAIGAHQAAIAVIQAIGVESQRPLTGQFSTLLLQGANRDLQIALRGNAPLGAAHLLGGQIQGAFADHAACLVLQAVHPDACIALATNDAAMVVEDECSDIQPSACGKNALEAVVQCLGDAQGQGVAADHAATPVAQRGRGEGKASIAGDLATATVVHDTQLPQQQGSRRGDQALSTVDQFSPAQIERDGRIADQPAAALLIQPLQVGIDRTLGSDPAVLAVVHQVRNQREPGTAAYAALLAIVEAASTDLRGPLGADDAALAIVEAGAAQDGTGVGDHPAPLVVQCTLAGKRQGPGAGDCTALVVQPTALHAQASLAAQAARLIAQYAVQNDVDALLAAEQAAVAIEQFGAIQAQPITTGEYPAVLVEYPWRGEAKSAIADGLAASVVQLLGDVQCHLARAGDFARTVVDPPGGNGQVAISTDQTAAAVVEAIGLEHQRTLAAQFATRLVKGCHAGVQVTPGRDPSPDTVRSLGSQFQTTFAKQVAVIVFQTGHVDIDGALAADGATAVVQGKRPDIQASGAGENTFEAVVQSLGDAQRQYTAAAQAATLVGQRGGGECEGSVAGNFPAAVVHHAELAQEQGSRRGDQALSAIGQGSLVQVEYDAGITDQPPFALLIESLDICVDHAFGSDPAFLAVIHLSSNQAEPVITAKIAFLAVVQNPGMDLRRCVGTDDP